MSNDAFSRIRSSRKAVRPMIDRDENEDEQRRDASGRKRVDVIECLMESSSDDDSNPNNYQRTPANILWLKFDEICHIRSVLAQTDVSAQQWSADKSYWKIFEDQTCFRCGKQLTASSFLPAFLSLSSSSSSAVCHICQQRICQTCSVSDFLLPLSTTVFPVDLQTLLQSSSSLTPVHSSTKKSPASNPQMKTVCYDCARIFDVIIQSATRFNPARNVQPHRSVYSSPLSSNGYNTGRSRQLPALPVYPVNSNRGHSTVLTTRF